MPKQLKKNKFLSTKANLFLTIFMTTIVVVLLILVLYKQGFLSKQKSSEPSFLYVQTAHSGSLSAEMADEMRTLTLHKTSPLTVYFSDRPDRITGHEPTEEFISAWGEGEDSFVKNPPNAVLDIIGEHSQSLLVIELMSAKYDSQTKTLEYQVKILDDETGGTFPETFNEAALFIDSAHKDFHCKCSGKKNCRCKFEYDLKKSQTKEFRGYCDGEGMSPEGLSVSGLKSGTHCTVKAFWHDYYSRSCTNWSPNANDTIKITVRCAQKEDFY